jgi:hypothetical protein
VKAVVIERPHDVFYRDVDGHEWSGGVEAVDLASIVMHGFASERFADAFRLLVDREGIVGQVLLEHPDRTSEVAPALRASPAR